MRAHNDLTSFREERWGLPVFLDLLTTCKTEQLRPQDGRKSSLIHNFWKDFRFVWSPAGIATSHPPPTSFALEPYQDAASIFCRISVTGRDLSCILQSLTLLQSSESHTTLRQSHKCQQEINSIIFYFLINLSSWQVQQKIIKPSGGKITFLTFKTGKSSSDVVAGSQEPQHLYINAWLPAEGPLLNNNKLMHTHIWLTVLMFGFPLKEK